MPTPPRWPDRYTGLLLGLACGDALGASVEFCERDSVEPVTGMVGGGIFQLAPGQWTNDTSMAMCLAESLAARPGFDPVDQMARYLGWYRHGYWSSKTLAFDIGQTTERALRQFEATRQPWCGPVDELSAGNGSVMRLGPVVLHYFPRQADVLHFAAESSRTTHGAELAVQGCRLLAAALFNLLKGCAKDDCLAGARQHVSRPELLALADGAFRTKARHQIESSGYVVHTLEAAFWCLHQTHSFQDAVLLAANLGDDADTVAAVTGQLAGAHYGARAIPEAWLDVLYRRTDIETLAICLRQD